MTNAQGMYAPKKLTAFILAAVLFVSAFLFAQPANASSSVEIVNNAEKIATDGAPVWAQGGWMMQEGDTFYWYGLDVSEPSMRNGVPNPNAKKKVSAYTSTDLVTWTAHREVVDFLSINTYVAANPGTMIPEFYNSQWFGRPLVQYNNIIDKYVMIMEQECCNVRHALSVWYSDSPVGPFTYQKPIIYPGKNYGNGDLGSIFTDDDGKTYVTYTVDWRLKSDGSSDHNSGIEISELTTTLNANGEYEIDLVKKVLLQSTGPYKEATTLFKKGSTYYMLASETNGFFSSRTYYYTASSVTGTWSPAYWISTTGWNGWYSGTNPTGANSFDTQIDQILPIQGTTGTVYLYIGDRWINMSGSFGKGRNPFYPLTFEPNGKPVLNGHEKWSLNLAAGTWSPIAPDPINTLLTYSIVNTNSGKALGITGQQTTSGATLEQRPYTSAASQSWNLVYAGGGYYNIQNSNSGLYMDIQNSSAADGGQSIQWSPSSASSQQWQLIDAGGGLLHIKNRNSGKLLSISGGSTADGAAVIQWAATGSQNQKWRFDPVAPIDLSKTYSIRNVNSFKFLGTVSNHTDDNTNIEQLPYTAAVSQSWQFEYDNGYYKIKNVNSGKYMDIAGSSTAEGANNIIKTASSSDSQLWELVHNGGGNYGFKNKNSGKMLGFAGGSKADKAVNKQWNPSGSANQSWRFIVLNP